MDLLCEHGFVGAYQQCEHEARQIISDLDFGVPISQMLRHVGLRRLLQTFVRSSIMGASEPLLFKSIEEKREEGINACFVLFFSFREDRHVDFCFRNRLLCLLYGSSHPVFASVASGGWGRGQIPKLMHSNDSCRSMASCSPPFHKLLRQPIWSRG